MYIIYVSDSAAPVLAHFLICQMVQVISLYVRWCRLFPYMSDGAGYFLVLIYVNMCKIVFFSSGCCLALRKRITMTRRRMKIVHTAIPNRYKYVRLGLPEI